MPWHLMQPKVEPAVLDVQTQQGVTATISAMEEGQTQPDEKLLTTDKIPGPIIESNIMSSLAPCKSEAAENYVKNIVVVDTLSTENLDYSGIIFPLSDSKDLPAKSLREARKTKRKRETDDSGDTSVERLQTRMNASKGQTAVKKPSTPPYLQLKRCEGDKLKESLELARKIFLTLKHNPNVRPSTLKEAKQQITKIKDTAKKNATQTNVLKELKHQVQELTKDLLDSATTKVTKNHECKSAFTEAIAEDSEMKFDEDPEDSCSLPSLSKLLATTLLSFGKLNLVLILENGCETLGSLLKNGKIKTSNGTIYSSAEKWCQAWTKTPVSRKVAYANVTWKGESLLSLCNLEELPSQSQETCFLDSTVQVLEEEKFAPQSQTIDDPPENVSEPLDSNSTHFSPVSDSEGKNQEAPILVINKNVEGDNKTHKILENHNSIMQSENSLFGCKWSKSNQSESTLFDAELMPTISPVKCLSSQAAEVSKNKIQDISKISCQEKHFSKHNSSFVSKAHLKNINMKNESSSTDLMISTHQKKIQYINKESSRNMCKIKESLPEKLQSSQSHLEVKFPQKSASISISLDSSYNAPKTMNLQSIPSSATNPCANTEVNTQCNNVTLSSRPQVKIMETVNMMDVTKNMSVAYPKKLQAAISTSAKNTNALSTMLLPQLASFSFQNIVGVIPENKQDEVGLIPNSPKGRKLHLKDDKLKSETRVFADNFKKTRNTSPLHPALLIRKVRIPSPTEYSSLEAPMSHGLRPWPQALLDNIDEW